MIQKFLEYHSQKLSCFLFLGTWWPGIWLLIVNGDMVAGDMVAYCYWGHGGWEYGCLLLLETRWPGTWLLIAIGDALSM